MRVPVNNKNLYIMAAALIVLLYLLALKGQWGACSRLGAEAASLKLELAASRALAGSLEAEELALAATLAELSRYQNTLHAQPDSGQYLAAVGEEALQAGVWISEFLVGDCKDMLTHRESAVQLIVSGDYPRVVEFLHSVLDLGQVEIKELELIDASLVPAESSAGRGQALADPAGLVPEKGEVVARASLRIFSSPHKRPETMTSPPVQLPLGRPNVFIQAAPLNPAANVKKLPPLADTA